MSGSMASNSLWLLLSRACAIRNYFGRAIKNKTLPACFNGTSISNMTTHATRVRIAIIKVIILTS